MKIITAIFLLIAVSTFGAVPTTRSFRAAGGLVVTTNDITGIVTYDGSGISSPTGGVSASTATNIARAAVLVAPGANVTVVTNSTGTNIIYTVASSATLGPSTTQGAAMTNILWPNTLFVDSTNGTNATAMRGDLSKTWRDVRVAMAASQWGDLIWCLNGIHDTGSNTLVVLPGRKLRGQGWGTAIRGWGSLTNDGPVVVGGSDTDVGHLTIEHGGRNYYAGATYGFHSSGFNLATHGPTNATIHDVYHLGDTDCIYLRGTNYWDVTGWNNYCVSKFDALVQFSESSNGVSRWFNTFFLADLKGSVNPYSVGAQNAKAVTVQGGVAEFYNCVAIGTNGGLTTRGVSAAGGTTRWIGGYIAAAGTNAAETIAAERETGATFIYVGNQLGIDDIREGVTGSTIYGSQQTVVSNITQVPGSPGLVIRTTDPFFTDYVFFSAAGGVNIGGLTDPGAGRLQVGSLPGTGDYVASDANGLLFSTNGSAGGGSLVTNANQFAVDPTLTIKSNAFFTNTVFWGQLQDMNAGGTTNLDINGNTTLMYPQTANSGAFNIGPFGEGRYFAFSKSVGLLNMGSGAADTFKFTLASGAQTNAGPLSIAGAASFFSTVSIPTGATSNYVWTCTNATTGMGEWRASAGGGGGSNYLFDATVFNAPAGGGDVNVGIKSGAILPGVYADIGILYGGGVLDYGLYYDTGIDTLLYQDARFAPNYTNIAGISNGFWNFIVSPVLNDLPAGSLLRTTSAKRVGAVTIGANLTWDGTTLAATSGGGTGASTNEVLTNLIGTVVRNVTNVVSLSTSNATSKPITNSFTAGTLTLRGLEAGSNTTITANGSNYVIASTGGGGLTGQSNAVPFINGAGTALMIYTPGTSLNAPGFGFNPQSLNGPNAGYGGLMVFANESLGLATIGHPNPGSDFTGNTASALVVSNRFAPANQGFTSDLVRFEAVEVTGGGGTSFNPDSTLTRWRVWSSTSGSPTSTASNDVASITVDGRLKLAGGLLTGVGSAGQGSISFSTNHYKEGVATVTPSVERQLTNANPGINVSLPVAGITNQRVNVPLTAGQVLTHNGTNYLASDALSVLQGYATFAQTKVTVLSPTNYIEVPVVGKTWRITGTVTNSGAAANLYLAVNGDTNGANYLSRFAQFASATTYATNTPGLIIGTVSASLPSGVSANAWTDGRAFWFDSKMTRIVTAADERESQASGHSTTTVTSITNLVLYLTGTGMFASNSVFYVIQEGVGL